MWVQNLASSILKKVTINGQVVYENDESIKKRVDLIARAALEAQKKKVAIEKIIAQSQSDILWDLGSNDQRELLRYAIYAKTSNEMILKHFPKSNLYGHVMHMICAQNHELLANFIGPALVFTDRMKIVAVKDGCMDIIRMVIQDSDFPQEAFQCTEDLGVLGYLTACSTDKMRESAFREMVVSLKLKCAFAIAKEASGPSYGMFEACLANGHQDLFRDLLPFAQILRPIPILQDILKYKLPDLFFEIGDHDDRLFVAIEKNSHDILQKLLDEKKDQETYFPDLVVHAMHDGDAKTLELIAKRYPGFPYEYRKGNVIFLSRETNVDFLLKQNDPRFLADLKAHDISLFVPKPIPILKAYPVLQTRKNLEGFLDARKFEVLLEGFPDITNYHPFSGKYPILRNLENLKMYTVLETSDEWTKNHPQALKGLRGDLKAKLTELGDPVTLELQILLSVFTKELLPETFKAVYGLEE